MAGCCCPPPLAGRLSKTVVLRGVRAASDLVAIGHLQAPAIVEAKDVEVMVLTFPGKPTWTIAWSGSL